MVREFKESASLPEGKKADFLYTVADGVSVRDHKKKKHIEVSHGIIYGGWYKNGKRVSIKQPKVIMTTQLIDGFWDEIQIFAANEYLLKNTNSFQIVMEERVTPLKYFSIHFHSRVSPFYTIGCIILHRM